MPQFKFKSPQLFPNSFARTGTGRMKPNRSRNYTIAPCIGLGVKFSGGAVPSMPAFTFGGIAAITIAGRNWVTQDGVLPSCYPTLKKPNVKNEVPQSTTELTDRST